MSQYVPQSPISPQPNANGSGQQKSKENPQSSSSENKSDQSSATALSKLLLKISQKLGRLFLYFASLALLLVACIGLFLYKIISESVTQSISLADYRPPGVTSIYVEEEGRRVLIGEFFKEKRYLIPYDKIPALVIDAFLAAEDDGFFEHQGISPMAIMRAAYKNFMAGSVVEGGSTITQQVAKSLYLESDRNIIRKVKEAILASRIEKSLNKEQILYLYLNQIYLGNGAHGIQSAAKEYFRKDVTELTLPEAALLAGLPKAPSRFNPLINPKRAKSRQLYVLRRMQQNNIISEEQMLEAAAEPIRIYEHDPVEIKGDAAYALEQSRRYLKEKYGEKILLEDGLTVVLPTTREIQKSAKTALQNGLRNIDKRRGFRGAEKKLKDEKEIREFLAESRLKLIKKKVPFQMFLPDGTLSFERAMEDLGLASDEDLVVPEELYLAYVMAVNDSEKTATVGIGSIDATLPMANMEWAHPLVEPVTRSPQKPERPSQVLKRGDVVWVRLEKKVKPGSPPAGSTEDPNSYDGKIEFLAYLEQHPLVQGAIFSMDVETGEVLAIEGGYRFGKNKEEYESEFNRAVQAKRQPGSAFKPVIFALGIEKGFTPTSIIVDSPLVYKDEEIGKWKPTNFSEKFYGDTTYRTALIKSRNIPTIKLVQDLKIPQVIDFARRLGFTGNFNQDLSISLGSTETTPQELTQIYSLFPRLGRVQKANFFSKVINRDGLVLEKFEKKPSNILDVIRYSLTPSSWETPVSTDGVQDAGQTALKAKTLATPPPAPVNPNPESEVLNADSPHQDVANTDPSAGEVQGYDSQIDPNQRKKIQLPVFPNEKFPDQVMDPRVAFVMAHLMTEVVNYGTGRRALELGQPAAGKTGTTNEYKDAWFLGYTPSVVTGVWVGFDLEGSLGPGETGTQAALPIWVEFMKTAVKKYPVKEFSVPSGIKFASIDPASGKLALDKSKNAIREAFIVGTEPTERVRSDGQQTVESESEFFKSEFE